MGRSRLLIRWDLVAGATAAAATSAKTSGRTGRAIRTSGGENRQLNRCFFARTLRAGYLLLLVHHDFFEVLVAAVTNIFVDRHGPISQELPQDYSIPAARLDGGKHPEIKSEQRHGAHDQGHPIPGLRHDGERYAKHGQSKPQ